MSIEHHIIAKPRLQHGSIVLLVQTVAGRSCSIHAAENGPMTLLCRPRCAMLLILLLLLGTPVAACMPPTILEPAVLPSAQNCMAGLSAASWLCRADKEQDGKAVRRCLAGPR